MGKLPIDQSLNRFTFDPNRKNKILFMGRFLILVLIGIFFWHRGNSQEFVQEGIASYYADKFDGRQTASGEKYRHSKFTAAHRSLPFGTIVRVTNKNNMRSVEVKINDRGPYAEGRIIDLSKVAAERIDMINQGLAEVKIEVIDAGDGKGNNYDTGNSGQLMEPVEEREFYELSVSREDPKGFGVQIGSYRELANLVRLADNLKLSYKKKVTVQVSIINNVKVYRIIVGQEKTRQKAERLKKKLNKRYPDSFIVNFNDI